MRDRIRQRLTEYRAEALESIGSSRHSLTINEDTKAEFAEYMDRSARFIRHLAAASSAEYTDELREAGNKLKQRIKADTKSKLKAELDEVLDNLIKRKVEDFEVGYVEGKYMSATTTNTVNTINSQIFDSVLEITQSGKDVISKETAQKLEQLVDSKEINRLPEATRLDVLDQVSDVIEELKGATDTGKVHRGLKRLGEFVKSVASASLAESVAQLAVAWATVTD